MAFVIFQDTTFSFYYSAPPNSQNYKCVYTIDYPCFTLYYDYTYFGRDVFRYGVFIDTLHFYMNGEEYNYEDWSK